MASGEMVRAGQRSWCLSCSIRWGCASLDSLAPILRLIRLAFLPVVSMLW